MTEAQLNAWDSIQPTLTNKQAVVYLAICNRPSTLFELSYALGWPINCVSGRVSELTEKLLVKGSGNARVNPLSGRPGTVWEKALKAETGVGV